MMDHTDCITYVFLKSILIPGKFRFNSILYQLDEKKYKQFEQNILHEWKMKKLL